VQYRGRAALQRRVKPPKSARASALGLHFVSRASFSATSSAVPPSGQEIQALASEVSPVFPLPMGL
jgi:hypothetical protein